MHSAGQHWCVEAHLPKAGRDRLLQLHGENSGFGTEVLMLYIGLFVSWDTHMCKIIIIARNIWAFSYLAFSYLAFKNRAIITIFNRAPE